MNRLRPSCAGLAALALTLNALADEGPRPIFDGKTPAGWVTSKDLKPLPAANVQNDGLNPHDSGSYLILHEKPVKDFVLDFDYKITKGCNSGVFVRVGDPKDPVMTGLEVAIDDTKGTGMHDPGAFYDLVAPSRNTQKPASEWNHMTITAKGPTIAVALNGVDVSRIDLSRFDRPGKRPDGSDHKFRAVTIKDFDRPGYLGFQDHGRDCWFKNVQLKDL
jgi:hypothetical protein